MNNEIVESLVKNQILIVFYIYVNNQKEWKDIVVGQLQDLINSGIFTSNVGILHIVGCGEDISQNLLCTLVSDMLKSVNFEFEYSTENKYEYPGLLKCFQLSKQKGNADKYIMYLHTKGMVLSGSLQRSQENIILTQNLANNWKNVLHIFKKFKHIEKAGPFPSSRGFYWYNFFYARCSYIVKCECPIESPPNRYWYEEWIGDAGSKSCLDCFSTLNEKMFFYSQEMTIETMKKLCYL